MAYKKDQGRYARMTAFWSVFLLVGYGGLRSLLPTLRSWFPSWGEDWSEPLPLIGEVDLAKIVVLVVLAASAIIIYRFLERPKIADLLIDTEAEMRKVTWPTFGETWRGTIAVALTVAVLLFYLFAADYVLAAILPQLMGSTA